MPTKIVIIGTGFAGVWSALSAQRLLNLHEGHHVQVIVISPSPTLVIRVRLYEAKASEKTQDVSKLLESSGVQYVQGHVENINTEEQIIHFRNPRGLASELSYDRLVLAAGSSLARPSTVPGLHEFAFDIDSLSAASKLESHLDKLASLPTSRARDTIVVCGAGFTGIEMATELPLLLGQLKSPRIILIERAPVVGPELGPGPRQTICKALKHLAIETRLESAVSSIDQEGVVLTSGERIETRTVIWTAGLRANSLTASIPGQRDALGRLRVDENLRVGGCKNVFAAGDSAQAMTDKDGNFTLMSCQHAIPLGRFAGYNVAASLLDIPMLEYSQPLYTCLLDLGGWGAVLTSGWKREVQTAGWFAKQAKRWVNQVLIYPPTHAENALRMADPNLQSPGPLRLTLLVLLWTVGFGRLW